MSINIIAACDKNLGIGIDGKLPWKSSLDMKHFKQITSGGIVIMGRCTWESIPEKYRPLSNRYNIVVSNSLIFSELPEGLIICTDFNIAIDCAKKLAYESGNTKEIFVIGGSSIYNAVFSRNDIKRLYLTVISGDYTCDRFLNGFNGNFRLIESINAEEDSLKMKFNTYESYPNSMANMYLYQYGGLLNDILTNGNVRNGRNGGTLSVFSRRLEFDLSGGEFPLLTNRNVPLRHVFEELMWMLRGETNTKELDKRGVRIWNANSTREFLDSVGLVDLEEGEIGKTYGHEMRNFNGEIDQVRELMKGLRENPHGRRHILSLWNPSDLKACALPPCVFLYQFYVNNQSIDLQINIRSSDVPVALHWNIAHGALFLHLVCCMLGKNSSQTWMPGRLIFNLGDAHIYEPHLEEVRKMVRELHVLPMPKLSVNSDGVENVWDYKWENIELIGYLPRRKKYNLPMIA